MLFSLPLLEFVKTLPGGQATIAAVLFMLAAILLIITVMIIHSILMYLASKTKNDLDDEILRRMKVAMIVLALLTAAFVAVEVAYPGLSIEGRNMWDLYFIGLILVTAYAVERIVDAVIQWYGKEIESKTRSRLGNEVLPFIRKMMKGTIYLVALIIILDKMNIQVAPLLAGLGIAGLAVALALQDSLGNFFAGIYILADRPMKEGDYISTDGGFEGTVEKIGWRSTKLLTLAGNHVIIPNNKLAQTVVTNYYTPTNEEAMWIEIGVAYDEDVDKVMELLFAAVKDAMKGSDLFVNTKEPLIFFNRFGDFSLIFTVVFFINDHKKRGPAISRVNRAIYYTLKKNNIEIPFPVRTVYLHQQEQRKKKPKSG